MTSDIREQIVKFLPRLRRFCCAVAGNLEDGDDLMQETCIRALDRLHQWQEGTRLESWMFKIAQNIWIDKKRSARSRYETSQGEEMDNRLDYSTVNPAEARLELAQVQAHISELPDDQRVLIALICVDGLSYKEAAEITDVPIGTVMSRLTRARQALYSRMYGQGYRQ